MLFTISAFYQFVVFVQLGFERLRTRAMCLSLYKLSDISTASFLLINFVYDFPDNVLLYIPFICRRARIDYLFKSRKKLLNEELMD